MSLRPKLVFPPGWIRSRLGEFLPRTNRVRSSTSRRSLRVLGPQGLPLGKGLWLTDVERPVVLPEKVCVVLLIVVQSVFVFPLISVWRWENVGKENNCLNTGFPFFLCSFCAWRILTARHWIYRVWLKKKEKKERNLRHRLHLVHRLSREISSESAECCLFILFSHYWHHIYVSFKWLILNCSVFGVKLFLCFF